MPSTRLTNLPACLALQKNTEAVDTLETELRGIDERQSELKKLLYAKFGKSINLEDR